MVVCMPRVSVCELEADGVAADILNRHELSMCKATENLTRQCLCVEISDWTFNMLTLLQPLSPPSLPLLSLLAPFLNLLTPSHFLILHSIKGISWAGCNLGGGEAEETPVRQQCLPVTPTLPRYPWAPQPHENTWCSLDSLCCMCMKGDKRIGCVWSVGQLTKGTF